MTPEANTVYCASLEDMAAMISSFVQAGLVFVAHTDSLKIKLTGGF
jgi:hypothetical protein